MTEPSHPPKTQPTKPPPSASRRRDKPQLSCTLCRRRKLRCDRGQPCETCVRRGLSLSCVYVHTNPPLRTMGHGQDGGPAPNLPERITQLEQLVTSLMSNVNKPANHVSPNLESAPAEVVLPTNTQPSSVSDQNSAQDRNTDPSPQHPALADSFGRISLELSETTYVESTHWTAILDEIAELKDYFQHDNNRSEYQLFPGTMLHPEEPEILFGSHKPMNKQEIVNAMPPRSVVDRLVAVFFFNKAIVPVIVHSSTFLKEYEQFWEQPLETPLPWIALLFAVMCLAQSYQYQPGGVSSDPKPLIEGYREKVIQCLVQSKYTKCAPYTIETLVLLLHVEYIRNQDTQIETWILLGVIIRLALRMGYHRDPSHFPHISPFHGEMRRRVWAIIFQLDILSSTQVGLPRMIRGSNFDTAEPRNLLDDDFHKDISALPLPRPNSIQTQIQYVVAKNKILAIFGTISDLITSTRFGLSSYPEVMRLDGILRETYMSLPEVLQTRSMTKSIMDSPDIIIGRLYIALTYQKAKCILHYKFMLPARTDDRYRYSRSACIEAALRLLEYQWILNQETQAGGRLHNDRWKVSSIVNASFFLATTLLCLELDYDITREPASNSPSTSTDNDTRHRIMNALHNSYLIWIQTSDTSGEARKAADVLRFVLGKAQKMDTRRQVGLGEAFNSTPTETINSGGLPTPDASVKMSGIAMHPSQYTTNRRAATDIPLEPSSIPQLLRLNAGIDIDYSDIVMEPSNFASTTGRPTGVSMPLGLTSGDTWLQTESLDEFLEISPNFPGIF